MADFVKGQSPHDLLTVEDDHWFTGVSLNLDHDGLAAMSPRFVPIPVGSCER